MAHGKSTAVSATKWPRIRLRRLGDWFHLCWQRARERRALESLSDHHLRDLGLTPEQVREEIARPPWR